VEGYKNVDGNEKESAWIIYVDNKVHGLKPPGYFNQSYLPAGSECSRSILKRPRFVCNDRIRRARRHMLPTQHSGEGPLVRVQLADVTYAPNQGDRVKFLLYRTSAGDKLAKAVSLIS